MKVKGRKIGSTELSIDEMAKIVELTEEGKSRGEIAREVGRCKMTVYNYQKKLF
jgi:DNA-binding NarL/FixJ family response regulator